MYSLVTLLASLVWYRSTCGACLKKRPLQWDCTTPVRPILHFTTLYTLYYIIPYTTL